MPRGAVAHDGGGLAEDPAGERLIGSLPLVVAARARGPGCTSVPIGVARFSAADGAPAKLGVSAAALRRTAADLHQVPRAWHIATLPVRAAHTPVALRRRRGTGNR